MEPVHHPQAMFQGILYFRHVDEQGKKLRCKIAGLKFADIHIQVIFSQQGRPTLFDQFAHRVTVQIDCVHSMPPCLFCLKYPANENQ